MNTTRVRFIFLLKTSYQLYLLKANKCASFFSLQYHGAHASCTSLLARKSKAGIDNWNGMELFLISLPQKLCCSAQLRSFSMKIVTTEKLLPSAGLTNSF